jgi:DNA-binding NarL/FixJ family response regulator
LVSHEEPAALTQALQAGSHGLLLRRASAGALVSAVHAVTAGGTFLSDEASAILLRGFIRQRNGDESADPLRHLSERERQVLHLTVNGLTSSQIAEQLAISSKSVDTYRGRLMAKIGVRNATGLMSFAREHGLAQSAFG